MLGKVRYLLALASYLPYLIFFSRIVKPWPAVLCLWLACTNSLPWLCWLRLRHDDWDLLELRSEYQISQSERKQSRSYLHHPGKKNMTYQTLKKLLSFDSSNSEQEKNITDLPNDQTVPLKSRCTDSEILGRLLLLILFLLLSISSFLAGKERTLNYKIITEQFKVIQHFITLS